MGLFVTGDFTLHSGAKSRWKIDCDVLTDDDWDTLAVIALERLPPFRITVGIPQGGMKFARALQRYATNREDDPILLCDDVLTTGRSFYDARNGGAEYKVIGVAAFGRGYPPAWVKVIFQM
jgi:orotate phosphoribosyltransferase